MTERLLIGIEATRHCNLRCVHCLRADTRAAGEIPIALVDRLFAEARAFGRPHVAFTGGEPTLHRRFFELFALVRRHGLTCSLVTNGQNFPALVSELAAFKPELQSVAFSLDGAVEATHDRIRGAGTFRRVLFAIAVARYRGLHVSVQLAVNRANRHELRELARLCRELGVNRLYVCHTQPTPTLYAARLQLSPEEWLDVEREVRALERRRGGVRPTLGIGVHDPGVLAPCLALQQRSLNVDWAGHLTLCCQLSGVGDHDDDHVVDLDRVPLIEGRRRLLTQVNALLASRLELLAGGRPSLADGFQCWSCYKLFGKLDWLRRYPDDAWVRADADSPQPVSGAGHGPAHRRPARPSSAARAR